MENKLIKTENEPLSEKQLIGYLDTMGLAQKLTDKEKTQFLEISKAYGLNPFKREIYCSKYGETLSIITGYETYIKRAERSGFLDGWKVETFGTVESNDLKAVITIYRTDRKHAFTWEVLYSEYVQKTNTGAVTKFWQKAQTMTKKVAIAQGFRLCFNDELGGMPYTSEEMPEPKIEEGTVTVLQPKINDVNLAKKYINLLNSAPHVITAEEVIKFSVNTKGVPASEWTEKALNNATDHVKTLIEERELLLTSKIENNGK